MKYRFILACCLLLGSAAAARPAPAPAQTTVSLELKQTPLHQALSLLFSQSGLQYVIAPDVPDGPVTMHVHDIPFAEALRTLLRLSSVTTYMQGAGVIHRDVTYRKEGDIYVIGLRQGPPPGP